jgi:putative ATP-dependent endonuclease of OLD family
MHITELRIRNFRNFLSARFRFQNGVNTLIGENGSGKTNVLHALRLILDESLERNAVNLRESDFCRDLPSWRGEWIIISAHFAELDPSEGCQILKHRTGHMDGTNSGTCTFLFRPKREVRKKLYDATGKLSELKGLREAITVDDYEACFTGRAGGDFLDDTVYQACAGNAKGVYPNPERDDESVLGVRIHKPMHEEVACTFVRALRDVVNELKNYRSSPLLNLLRGLDRTIDISEADSIVGQVQQLNKDISSLKEIKNLATGIEGALKKAVGYTYGPNISIESALPDSMERLLQRLAVLAGDTSGSSYRGELQDQSLGAANLIYLALKLLEYELKLSSDRVAHFFLIEEPEAHIHTHIQKTLFANLPSSRTQVIVSTHSTHISSAAKIGSVNILAKKDDHAEVYQPANKLPAEQLPRLERYLDAVRSTLLFAKGVVLVEGDTELVMVSAMLKAAFGCSSDELGFSIISMNAAVFEHVALLFSEDRLRRPCATLTDSDTSIYELPEDPDDDDDDEKHARAAEVTGHRRRDALNIQFAKNPWVRMFFAQNTFEVDFLFANNANEIVATLPSIYKDAVYRQKSEALLRSTDRAKGGKEVLRLAKSVGKGWFALLVAEHLDVETLIPRYILRAVAFACHTSISANTLRQIAEYRVNHAVEGHVMYHEELAPLVFHPKELPNADYLASYRSLAPDDDFSILCGFLEEFQS